MMSGHGGKSLFGASVLRRSVKKTYLLLLAVLLSARPHDAQISPLPFLYGLISSDLNLFNKDCTVFRYREPVTTVSFSVTDGYCEYAYILSREGKGTQGSTEQSALFEHVHIRRHVHLGIGQVSDNLYPSGQGSVGSIRC